MLVKHKLGWPGIFDTASSRLTHINRFTSCARYQHREQIARRQATAGLQIVAAWLDRRRVYICVERPRRYRAFAAVVSGACENR